ncbi:unnamed protein product [Linum trigynum]|uniref:Uncharacterized protein n=1 Tax=Linum trigynum TaxID=586398 RepID=A0AAV2E834_9ROSI
MVEDKEGASTQGSEREVAIQEVENEMWRKPLELGQDHAIEKYQAMEEDKDDDATMGKELAIHKEASQHTSIVHKLIQALRGRESTMTLLESIATMEKGKVKKTRINSNVI